MRDVVCWEPAHVGKVINIDADFVPDEVFWAVHLDAPLHVQGAVEESPYKVLDPIDLLSDFLSPDRNHFQLAVLGQTGAGKSHLIHWMRQRIENDERRAVVTVRRLETNLRAILDKLINQLPDNRRRRFKDELDGAGAMLKTKTAQKASLLFNLSVAIGQDDVRAGSGLPRDAEEHFLRTLPDLLSDPQFKSDYFLKDGEIIDELVDRLFSTAAGRREAERLEFSKENLPLRNVDTKSASAKAREALDGLLFDQDRTIPAALAVINRNLGDAIALSMNFSGDRLGELMGELRAELAQQGRELVLLFEEFARFQGYDGALLDALLVQGGDRRCNIRWAIACTRGFYKGLPDTARTRMTAVVDMDRTHAELVNSMGHVERFAGRYLNAARWGRDGLRRAYDSGRDDGDVPNKCDDCTYRPDCHKAFGRSEDGFGLYPLTARSIEIMSERAASGANLDDAQRFNPRQFQRGVLLPTLTKGGEALREHVFPNGAFLDEFSGVSSAVPPIIREQLKEKHGAKGERYVALFDLWSGSPNGDGLAAEIYAAFGLSRLSADQVVPAEQGKQKPKEPPPPAPKPPPGPDVPPEIQGLRDWPTGGSLSQSLAQKLRILLFRVINRSIDWDDIGLEQNKFAGATEGSRPFRQQSVGFVRQTTMSKTGVAVQVTLPFDPGDEREFNRTAIALEGLLEAERHGAWTFPDAEEKLAALLELTERCALEVVGQLHALEGNREEWDPLAGAMELLAVTAALRGALPGDASAQKILDECFRTPPDRQAFHNGDLKSVYDRLRKNHADLVAFVRAQASGSKGGVVGAFLDPRRPLRAIKEFVDRPWRLKRRPKPLSVDFYYRVGTLYESVSASLDEAVEGEKSLRSEWIARVEAAFGSNAKKDEIATAAEKFVGTIHDSGLGVGSVDRMRRSIEQFRLTPFDKTRNEARALMTADASSVLATCGRGDVEAATAADALAAALQKVLDDANKELTVRERNLGVAGGTSIEAALARIGASLDDIIDNLTKLKAWADAAQ